MANLKDLRKRISSVKSTQKITSAMKMVAAARLRKSQNMISSSVPYADTINNTLARIVTELKEIEEQTKQKIEFPELLVPKTKDEKYLIVLFTSDRGLCGNFNSQIVKEARAKVAELEAEGKQVQILSIGKKGSDLIKYEHPELIYKTYLDIAKKGAVYSETNEITAELINLYKDGEFDKVIVMYNHFKSAIERIVKTETLLPFNVEDKIEVDATPNFINNSFYDYEPDVNSMLEYIAPLAVNSAMFNAIIHSQASEHSSRMTSMDNATRNAGDMINKLTLTYNRTRQACITSELIEIISGAEALAS